MTVICSHTYAGCDDRDALSDSAHCTTRQPHKAGTKKHSDTPARHVRVCPLRGSSRSPAFQAPLQALAVLF